MAFGRRDSADQGDVQRSRRHPQLSQSDTGARDELLAVPDSDADRAFTAGTERFVPDRKVVKKARGRFHAEAYVQKPRKMLHLLRPLDRIEAKSRRRIGHRFQQT